MRRWPAIGAVLLTCMLALGGQGSDSHARDFEAIQALLREHGERWTRGDWKGAAAVMTEDADWVTSGGTIMRGRPAIEAWHRNALTGFAKGSRHTHPGVPHVRFLDANIAVVDGESYTGGLRDSSGKELPGETGYYTAIFVKQQGNWKVAAFRSLPQVKVALADALRD